MNGDADAESPPETWLRYADIDLALMRSVLNAGGPAGEVCFHAQQATEKALKGLLASQQIKVPYTHHLVALYEMAPAMLRPGVNLERLDRLTELEAQSRYPGDWLEPTAEEAQWSSGVAASVVQAVKEAFGESGELLG